MIINYMNIVIFRFKAVIVLQPCFSAKEHECVKMYAFDMFETVFLLCPKTRLPVIAVLLLLLLSVRSCVWSVCCSYHRWNGSSRSVMRKGTHSDSEQSGILRTPYSLTWANIGIRIQGGNNRVYTDRDRGICKYRAIYDVEQQIESINKAKQVSKTSHSLYSAPLEIDFNNRVMVSTCQSSTGHQFSLCTCWAD